MDSKRARPLESGRPWWCRAPEHSQSGCAGPGRLQSKRDVAVGHLATGSCTRRPALSLRDSRSFVKAYYHLHALQTRATAQRLQRALGKEARQQTGRYPAACERSGACLYPTNTHRGGVCLCPNTHHRTKEANCDAAGGPPTVWAHLRRESRVVTRDTPAPYSLKK